MFGGTHNDKVSNFFVFTIMSDETHQPRKQKGDANFN